VRDVRSDRHGVRRALHPVPVPCCKVETWTNETVHGGNPSGDSADIPGLWPCRPAWGPFVMTRSGSPLRPSRRRGTAGGTPACRGTRAPGRADPRARHPRAGGGRASSPRVPCRPGCQARRPPPAAAFTPGAGGVRAPVLCAHSLSLPGRRVRMLVTTSRALTTARTMASVWRCPLVACAPMTSPRRAVDRMAPM